MGQVEGQHLLAAPGEHAETLLHTARSLLCGPCEVGSASCLPLVIDCRSCAACMQSACYLLQQPAAVTAELCLNAESL